jgi:archaetidylinositol phosphate synthase
MTTNPTLDGLTHVAPRQAAPFREARRELSGLTAGVEKRALAWLAPRLSEWVTPDHLTALGLLAMALGGLAYAASGRHPWLLLVVNLALFLNWFGDSLDGTLARHRKKLRPRYGFYVDHIVDAFGALFLLAGLAISGLMGPATAAVLLIVYYLLSINIYLATHTLGRFRMSYGPVGGTELRILLALLNLGAWLQPELAVLGHGARLFDVAGVLATVGLTATLLKSVVDNTCELYRLERL